MKKSGDNQNTNLMTSSKSLQVQVQTSKKETETLEKQIDNLIMENNFLRSQNNSGKYQLLLIQKEKEIKNIKEMYQNQINLLNEKLENYTKLRSNSDQLNIEERQNYQFKNNLQQNKNYIESTNCQGCGSLKNQIIALKKKYLEMKSEKDKVSKQNIKKFYNPPPDFGQTMIQISKELHTLKQIIQNKEAIIHNLNQLLFQVKQFNQQLKSDLETVKTKYILETSHYKEAIQKLNVKAQETQNLKQQLQKYKKQMLRSEKTNESSSKKFVQSLQLQKKINTRIQIQKQFQQKYKNQVMQLKNEIHSLVELNNMKSYNQNETIIIKQKLENMIKSQNALRIENQKLQSVIKQRLIQRQKYQSINITNYNLSKRIEILENQNKHLNNQLSKNIFMHSKRSASTSHHHQEQHNNQMKNNFEKLKLQNQKLKKLNRQLQNQLLNHKINQSSRSKQKTNRTRAQNSFLQTPRKINKGINPSLNTPNEKVQWMILQEKINSLKTENKQIKKLLNYKIF